MSHSKNVLPSILAGPMLRRCTTQEVAFWLVTRNPSDLQLHISLGEDSDLRAVPPDQQDQQSFQIGAQCYVIWVLWTPKTPIPEKVEISYDFYVTHDNTHEWMTHILPDIIYGEAKHPSFVVDLSVKEIVHGSCRKPHHRSADGLAQLDEQLSERLRTETRRPNFLMMSGDQIYADDVAAPMLSAIHQVIKQLGLFGEILTGATVDSAAELYEHPDGYFRRTALLPDNDANEKLNTRFWKGKRKPIFTSITGNNHLITFAEVMAMYILVWSPVMWRFVNLDNKKFAPDLQAKYDYEKPVIHTFRDTLWQVRRVLAHLPVYMIFDDHDITDDWNLTRAWEEASYTHPFSKQIIGNALLGYLLCQGWGNNPQAFLSLQKPLSMCFNGEDLLQTDDMIVKALSWNTWHYKLPTQPPTLVLDTRTRRWRSESNATKPSGLMDWESLSELQQQLIGEKSVILISPAPIFGVKLIEVIQKAFTFFGKALMVDAENWMAHKGTASVMLNIFRHQKTPELFIILSGDVHYSFVYDVSLRFSRTHPQICQITSSGIKNEFPRKLLLLLDKLNRWLFHKNSPLNWLTRRRHMSIRPRKPPGNEGRTLLNASGLGILKLDENNGRVKVSALTAEGKELDFH